jgi:hypothetical protein
MVSSINLRICLSSIVLCAVKKMHDETSAHFPRFKTGFKLFYKRHNSLSFKAFNASKYISVMVAALPQPPRAVTGSNNHNVSDNQSIEYFGPLIEPIE